MKLVKHLIKQINPLNRISRILRYKSKKIFIFNIKTINNKPLLFYYNNKEQESLKIYYLLQPSYLWTI